MAINIKKYLLLAIILFVFSSFLSAQNAGYFIQENGDEVKYIQRFVWSGGKYALHYEVIFEREINGEYKSYLKETTTSQFIELSLPPGAYRFRVIPYDILGRPTEGSSWVNIQVFAVSQPEQYKEPEPEIPPAVKIEEEPGKPVFFRIGASLGGRFSVYGNQYFGASGDPNVGLRTNIVFKIPLDIYIGAELAGDINRYGNLEEWKLYFYTFGLNFLAEKWSPRKIFGVGFRFGIIYPSINIQKNWHGKNRDEMEYFRETSVGVIVTEDSFYANRLIPNIGADFYWLIKKHLLLDVGFNFIHVPSIDDDYLLSGFFCPMIGISYQF